MSVDVNLPDASAGVMVIGGSNTLFIKIEKDVQS